MFQRERKTRKTNVFAETNKEDETRQYGEGWVDPDDKSITAEIEEAQKEPLPESFNWCEDGSGMTVCAPVSNQYLPQYCGGCWALSAVGAMSDRFLRWGLQVELSTQDVLDCAQDTLGVDVGCNDGGEDYQAYSYIFHKGLPPASCRPYLATSGYCPMHRCTWCKPGGPKEPPCTPIPHFSLYSIQAFSSLQGELAMQKEILTRGPITCGITLSKSFDAYSDGVFFEHHHTPLAHDIEVVGWGVDYNSERRDNDQRTDAEASSGTPYWIVKNSFGSVWGEKGYGRIFRGQNASLSSDKCFFPIVTPPQESKRPSSLRQSKSNSNIPRLHSSPNPRGRPDSPSSEINGGSSEPASKIQTVDHEGKQDTQPSHASDPYEADSDGLAGLLPPVGLIPGSSLDGIALVTSGSSTPGVILTSRQTSKWTWASPQADKASAVCTLLVVFIFVILFALCKRRESKSAPGLTRGSLLFRYVSAADSDLSSRRTRDYTYLPR